jgi:ribonuclease PH
MVCAAAGVKDDKRKKIRPEFASLVRVEVCKGASKRKKKEDRKRKGRGITLQKYY